MRKKIKNGLIMLLAWVALSVLIFILWGRDVKSSSNWNDEDRISVIVQNENLDTTVSRIYILHDNITNTDVLVVKDRTSLAAVRLTDED